MDVLGAIGLVVPAILGRAKRRRRRYNGGGK